MLGLLYKNDLNYYTDHPQSKLDMLDVSKNHNNDWHFFSKWQRNVR